MQGKTKNELTKSNFGKWGWITILVCLLAYFVGGMLVSDGLNIYVTGLVELRGWDRAEMLSWSTYGGWLGVVSTLIFAQIALKHRNGARWLMIITLLIAAVAIYTYGHSTTFVGYAISVVVTSVVYTGYGSVSANTIQTNWFPRKKGIALGWSTIGFPLCTMIFPVTANWIMGKVGTENLFTVIGVFVVVVVVFLLIRTNPEDRGVTPDNLPIEAPAAEEKKQTGREMSLKEVAKTPQVWLIGIALGLLWLVTAGIISQFVTRITGMGLDRSVAVNLMALMGFFGIFGSYLWGLIDSAIGTKKACLIYAVWYAVALVLLIVMSGSSFVMYLAVFMVGISVGGICNLIPSYTATIYGRENFRSANRIVAPVSAAVKSSAYLYVGRSMAITGSLIGTYIGLIIICAIAFILVLLIRPMKKAEA